MKGPRGQKRQNNRKPRGDGVSGLTVTPAIFPSRFVGKMFYDFQSVIAPAAGTNTVQVFRANSVHDPDFSGAGTTAAGYAALSVLYQRFRVVAVKAIITADNQSTQNVLMNISANTLNTIGTSITTALAQRYVYQIPLGSGAGIGSRKHTISFPIHKIAGVPKKQVLMEDDFAGVVTAPTVNNPVFLHVGFNNATGTVSSVSLNVRLEYSVIWSLPVNMTY